jgi:lysozyme family protein
MASPIPFTPTLSREYDELFGSCAVRADRLTEVDGLVRRIVANRARYTAVADSVGIPWHFIAAVHCMECGLSFERHLHNGDPLTDRTYHVPAGRPKTGTPPFTWEESAVDALADRRNGDVPWTTAGILYRFEAYNGFGYRRYHPTVNSPYLWSYSNLYTQGKYVGDGRFDATAVSRQCGAAVLLHRMQELGELRSGDGAAALARDAATPPAPGVVAVPLPRVAPRNGDVAPLLQYWTGGAPTDAVRELQRFLNRMPGIAVVVDGKAGEHTSEAFRLVTGRYLLGDPRGVGA